MGPAQFHPIVQEWFRKRFAAPTGSGKTLSAFLVGMDRLLRQAISGEIREQTYFVYVSPPRALSNDIQGNLLEPLAELPALAREHYPHCSGIRALMRTGDISAAERQRVNCMSPAVPRRFTRRGRGLLADDGTSTVGRSDAARRASSPGDVDSADRANRLAGERGSRPHDPRPTRMRRAEDNPDPRRKAVFASVRSRNRLAGTGESGAVLHGQFTRGATQEWCDRRLLARIHCLTLEGLRRRIAAVSPEQFRWFLSRYQHARSPHKLRG